MPCGTSLLLTAFRATSQSTHQWRLTASSARGCEVSTASLLRVVRGGRRRHDERLEAAERRRRRLPAGPRSTTPNERAGGQEDVAQPAKCASCSLYSPYADAAPTPVSSTLGAAGCSFQSVSGLRQVSHGSRHCETRGARTVRLQSASPRLGLHIPLRPQAPTHGSARRVTWTRPRVPSRRGSCPGLWRDRRRGQPPRPGRPATPRAPGGWRRPH
jgi:hypothetical protein